MLLCIFSQTLFSLFSIRILYGAVVVYTDDIPSFLILHESHQVTLALVIDYWGYYSILV